MPSPLYDEFVAYSQRVSLTRIRMKEVPEAMKPLVKCYRQALSAQLSDPDNESWDSLGPNEHANARQAVRRYCAEPVDKQPKGNCPRCDGTGFIRAYSHIHGGRCLQCGGTGNIKG